LKSPVAGRNVLLVDDIVDTGNSLTFLEDYLKKKKPASLQFCCLLDKPSRRHVPVTVHYRGFTVPDKFVVGYGMDYAEQYRNLPDICVLTDSFQLSVISNQKNHTDDLFKPIWRVKSRWRGRKW